MALVLLIFLLMNPGVFGEGWNVIYETKSICALKGSSVNMSCTYTFPQGHSLTDTFWIKKTNVEIKSLKDYPEYKYRVEYIEDRQIKTAVLRLNNVTENDAIEYCFRFITDKDRWTGQPGIQLHVSALQVQAPQLVLEKETLNLTCRSSCYLTDRFIWYKDGQALNFTRDILQFQSVRSDSGRYSCAVRGHEHLPSPAVNISVEYPPSVSVLITGSSVIVEGDSVTLNCISDSNPPALNFSWFKGGMIVGSGRTFSISNIRSDDSGEYKCRSRNKHGEKDSDTVMLNVMYRPRNVSVLISESGVIVEGDSVTLNCSSDSNPPAEINWIKGGMIVGSGRIFSITNITSESSGNYYCSASNNYGSQTSADVNVNVMYRPRSVSVLISGSGVIVEGDSVTLNCISDSNPPALNFSWFKENETSAVGSGQSFSISSFNSSFSGRFYCEAQNKHGSGRSASVSLTVKVVQRPIVVIIAVCATVAIVAGLGLLFLIIAFIRNKRRNNDPKDLEQKKPSTEKSDRENATIQDGSDKDTNKPEEDEIHYASITVHHPTEKSDRENATIQDGSDKDTNKPEEDEIHYASITVHHPTEAKSTASRENELSVIYSSVR